MTATLRLIPQDPQWLYDFYMTGERLLAPYHAAWAARRNGIADDVAPAYPVGLERLTGLDAMGSLDAWSNVHHAFPEILRTRRALRDIDGEPAHGSRLRAPDGRRLVPLHPVTVAEEDLRGLRRVRRTLRAGAKANPSFQVTHHPDGFADIERVAGPGDYAGMVERTVAVLNLAPDEDVEVLAAALAPARFAAGARRVGLTAGEYEAYERFAGRLATAATAGDFRERAMFRLRY
ncbi:hypothetical protein [Streptomyces sp. NBC_00582]|uniref:hypothetical protein n=1 Tax=Streptomyces sp. NBC_00582 TaxID=2975783 RepID=UPI002E807C9F|nr:hypothetical protein [Streptomyces sp. NBC_00582]WUB59322.1 hypothetical protein OG852_02315 [Streptomyces sp. NBC_00582]